MIQRIQSVWLFIASICAFLSLKMPFYSGTNSANVPSYKLVGTENIYFTLLTAIIGATALFTIFLYSNRKLQLRFCFLGILLEALLIFLYLKEASSFLPGTGTYALTSILQAIVFLCFFLAAKGIRNDNRIVKESNRLR